MRLRTDLLVPLSRWVTPPILERRFDARFFAAMAPVGFEPTLVGEEVAAHAWHRPVDALESMAASELSMWLPTSTTLTQLLHVESIDDVRSRLTPGPLGSIKVDGVGDEIVRIGMPAGGGVAGQPVDAYLVGRKRFVLIDPGDPTGPAIEQALTKAAELGGEVEAIALTCAEPDHAAGAESIREQLGIESWSDQAVADIFRMWSRSSLIGRSSMLATCHCEWSRRRAWSRKRWRSSSGRGSSPSRGISTARAARGRSSVPSTRLSGASRSNDSGPRRPTLGGFVDTRS